MSLQYCCCQRTSSASGAASASRVATSAAYAFGALSASGAVIASGALLPAQMVGSGTCVLLYSQFPQPPILASNMTWVSYLYIYFFLPCVKSSVKTLEQTYSPKPKMQCLHSQSTSSIVTLQTHCINTPAMSATNMRTWAKHVTKFSSQAVSGSCLQAPALLQLKTRTTAAGSLRAGKLVRCQQGL